MLTNWKKLFPCVFPMEGVKRPQSAQDYGQLVGRTVRTDGGIPQVGDPIVASSGGIGIPPSRVPGGALRARSAETAAVPPNPRGDLPMSWLGLTLENTAGLTEDEIVRRLSNKGIFDASKFETVLFLPDGYQIAMQLANGMSGGCLLKLFGESRASSENFVYHMISGKFLERIMEESPTIEETKEYLRVKYGLSIADLQNAEVDEQLTYLAQTMKEVYTNQDRRDEFEGERRNLNSLIISKFPPIDMGNQACWNNIITCLKI